MTIVFTRILLPLALRQAGLSHPRLRLKQQRGRTFTSSAVLRWWAARSPQLDRRAAAPGALAGAGGGLRRFSRVSNIGSASRSLKPGR
jgi:hypothetical protein